MAKAEKQKSARPAKAKALKESSSAYFARLRPKFLDWNPPSEEDLRLEARQRQDERDAQLKKVTELEKARLAEKRTGRKKKTPP